MILAFISQKGGASKTTCSVAVASESMLRGKRVLLADADPQQSAATWHSIATENGHPAPTTIAVNATMHKAEQLPRISSLYDLTVIDCPPRHGDVQRSALMIADVAIIPCGPSGLDAWALTTTLDLVREAQVLRPALRAAIVITRVQSGTSSGKHARKVLEASGVPVLRASLRYRVAYQDALNAGLGVTAYDRGEAAREVRKLVDEIEDMENLKVEAAE